MNPVSNIYSCVVLVILIIAPVLIFMGLVARYGLAELLFGFAVTGVSIFLWVSLLGIVNYAADRYDSKILTGLAIILYIFTASVFFSWLGGYPLPPLSWLMSRG